jgi:hypothetical protein
VFSLRPIRQAVPCRILRGKLVTSQPRKKDLPTLCDVLVLLLRLSPLGLHRCLHRPYPVLLDGFAPGSGQESANNTPTSYRMCPKLLSLVVRYEFVWNCH